MKRVLIKASKSTSQAGRVKTVTIHIVSGTSSVTGKALVKTK